MNKVEIAKQAVKFMSGLGVTRIIGSIVANQVPARTVFQKATVVVATAVIGSMASDALGEHTDGKIDKVVEWWEEQKEKEATKEDQD
jgi:heme O synthase-like polyprenyltransferase